MPLRFTWLKPMNKTQKLTKEERRKRQWLSDHRKGQFNKIVNRIMKYRQLVYEDFTVPNKHGETIRFIRQFNEDGEHEYTLVVLYNVMGEALMQTEYDHYYLSDNCKFISHDYNAIDMALQHYFDKYRLI